MRDYVCAGGELITGILQVIGKYMGNEITIILK